MDEKGYIKFNCQWNKTGPPPRSLVADLNKWRDRLRRRGLVGAYENGIGYGNLSKRTGKSGQFIITGSNTGHLEVLDGNGYTRVLDYDFSHNQLTCAGPIKASSESLTHAAIYTAVPWVNGVIHIHSPAMWERLIDVLPTTSRRVEYGTPEMAEEMIRLLRDERNCEPGVVVMGGHKDGIVGFGKTLAAAGKVLLKYYHEKTLV